MQPFLVFRTSFSPSFRIIRVLLQPPFAKFLNVSMTDFNMKNRDGYKGLLNKKIEERCAVLSIAIGEPHLQQKFPHLSQSVTSWKKEVGPITGPGLAEYIDHTVLKANATKEDITKLCEEAKKHNFKAVCVNGYYVSLCKQLLESTSILIACVVGFPLGQMTSYSKAAEAAEAIKLGATEIDMVMNVGAMKEKNYKGVYDDIKAVKEACGAKALLKVIFETCLLTEEEIIDASILSIAAGAEFIKTSTGFSTRGATPEAIDIMLAVAGNMASVKASGGVRDPSSAQQYVMAGVKRIGTSSGIAIVAGGASSSGY